MISRRMTDLGLACLTALILGNPGAGSLSAQNAYKESYGFIRGEIGHNAVSANEIDVDFTNIGVRAGYMFIPNLGLEARLGTTVAPDKVPVGTTASELKTDYTAALLVRVQTTFDPGISPYLGLGIGGFEETADNSDGTTASISETGFAGYLGVDFQMKHGLAVGVDVGTLADDVTSLSLHFGWDF